ncbi:upstream activation factor subunit spp27-like protein [Leptotrombidium deliense]|uniref:Upstream activation factor subunit spp27-like protein n=1 Tax=Leptotrombidium deliense TaxID=299467 RepID=A0A443SW50_9ACAR|nr:upstream activation factor subunit spp27-like protein [Leptotrombidium deliense]
MAAARSEVNLTEIEQRIKEILKDANLETTTAKTVRKQLEIELNVDLIDYKKKIGSIIERIINENEEESISNTADGDDGSVDIKSNVEKYPNESSEEFSEEADEKLARKLQEAEQESARRSTRSGRNNTSKGSKKTKSKRKKKDSDSESEDEKPKKRTTGYMKSVQLSEDLAAFVGESELPRHAIIKKVYDYVKQNNLYDPKNKQFAICDNQLLKIFG